MKSLKKNTTTSTPFRPHIHHFISCWYTVTDLIRKFEKNICRLTQANEWKGCKAAVAALPDFLLSNYAPLASFFLAMFTNTNSANNKVVMWNWAKHTRKSISNAAYLCYIKHNEAFFKGSERRLKFCVLNPRHEKWVQLDKFFMPFFCSANPIISVALPCLMRAAFLPCHVTHHMLHVLNNGILELQSAKLVARRFYTPRCSRYQHCEMQFVAIVEKWVKHVFSSPWANAKALYFIKFSVEVREKLNFRQWHKKKVNEMCWKSSLCLELKMQSQAQTGLPI